MRYFKLGLAATAMVCALSATALAADCVKVGAVGVGLTHGIAELFATNALKNIIAGKGREGKGPIQMTCTDGPGTTTCQRSQLACKGPAPKTCLGAWLCV